MGARMDEMELPGSIVNCEFDPFSKEYLADPYPLFATLRERGPVFYSPPLDMWVVTRHRDIEAIFSDPRRFSAAITQSPVFPLSDAAQEVLAGGFRAAPVMSNCDPPKHGRIRAHNMRSFSARRIAVLTPKVRARAEEVWGRLLPTGRADLVHDLTYPLPAWMIFTLIGFPERDMEMLKSWCANRMSFTWGRPNEEEQVLVAQNMLRYWLYCEEFVAGRLEHQEDDFTSDLLRIHLEDPAQLSVGEITNVAYGLSFAGHETTTNLITNAVRQLLLHRDQWEMLCSDSTLINGAVEEALRYDTSVIAWRRVTTESVVIGGVDIPAGARLMLLLGSADRDPEMFPDPDHFDIRREKARRHLAFGKGIHFCLGAELARIEARIVLELLTRDAPDLRLVEDQPLQFPANIAFRGPEHLRVTWGASA